MIFRRLLRSMVATRETYVGFKSDTVISNAEFLYLAYGFELLKTEHEMDYQDALVTSQLARGGSPRVYEYSVKWFNPLLLSFFAQSYFPPMVHIYF